MNAEQYRRLYEFRRARGPLSLDQVSLQAKLWRTRGKHIDSPLAAVVRNAGKRLRRREAVVSAWERIADRQWLVGTVVDFVDEGMVVIAADSSTLCYELRRSGHSLERSLIRLVPGVRRVRFVVAGQPLQRAGGVV